MTTAFGSRLRRVDGTKGVNEDRVGDILSDSSDDGSPLGVDVARSKADKATLRRSKDMLLRSSEKVCAESAAAEWRHLKSKRMDAAKNEAAKEDEMIKGEAPKRLQKLKKKTSGSLARSRRSRSSLSTKRSAGSAGRKWYSDSDEEEMKTKKNSVNDESSNEEDSDLDAYIAGSVLVSRKKRSEVPPPISEVQARSKLLSHKEKMSGRDNDSGIRESAGKASAACDGTKKTNILELVTKKRALSPYGGKGKALGPEDIDPLATNSPAKGKADSEKPLSSELSTSGTPVLNNTRTGRPGDVPAIIINRRTNRLKHSASGSEYGGSPRVTISSTEEVFSPGLRKVPGAIPGRPGSGVLLEGWLRQKQRRGIKGLKKWNSRYFVLYAQLNEVRYYADVVQSAWGPIPLGEIGSISLRLIQRIGKLSHPKYKGCRFDITCRYSWGTHYAEDYVSSDDDNINDSNHVGPSSNNEKTTLKVEQSGTPKSSRVYSLVSDSPQATVAWVNMLDSLLIRSANSPRPDVDSPPENTDATSSTSTSRRARRSRAVARQQPTALVTESSVHLGPGELVPKAIIYAINFIFDSTPGIETDKFYETKPDATKLKVALKYLNEFAGESVTRKPTMDELKELLDAITAGGIVQLWLKQQEQPLVPFTMYDDFATLAREAHFAPFDLRPNLRALLQALPRKNLTMLACLLFHLNDVNVYSSKNGMDAARLAHLFTEFIVRPQKKSLHAGSYEDDVIVVCRLVEEMITNVDTFIDEKEAQLLEDNRL